jgi:hypothetical protein
VPAEVEGYHGRPILKRPVWTWEVPAYMFTGGLAGAASMLAAAADLSGRTILATSARRVAAIAALTAPPLLVSDLGRPTRFANMLRVAKPSSPMSVGSWTLAAYAPAAIASAGLGELRRAPRLCCAAGLVAGATGPVMATYTGVLVATTAIPVWQAARRELPFLFAASAAATAGAAATIGTPAESAGPARALAAGGGIAALAVTELMETRLGDLGEPYHEGRAGVYARLAKGSLAAGAAVVAGGGRGNRTAALAGGAALLAGSLLERWAVFRAGFQSAADPSYTVGPQRSRRDREATD